MKRSRSDGDAPGGSTGHNKRHHGERPSSKSRHSRDSRHSYVSRSSSDSRKRPHSRDHRHQRERTEQQRISKKQQSNFLADLEFRASIPQPPFEPKLLRIELPPNRRYTYCSSQLEKSVQRPIFFDNTLGIPIDIIDEDTYTPTGERQAMLKEDARLFIVGSDERKKALDQAKNWMLKGSLMQNNIYDRNTKNNVSIAEADTREAMEIERTYVVQTREEQIALIEETFDASQFVPKHPTNPSLEPLEVLEILPHDLVNEDEQSNQIFAFFTFKDAAPMDEVAKVRNKLRKEYLDDVSRSVAVRSALLQSYDNHHVMYLPAKEQPPEEEEKEELLWLKEFRLQPTLPVQSWNNFFMFEYEGEMLYARYHERHNVRKRQRTNNDINADEEIASRAKAVTLNYNENAAEEEEEVPAEGTGTSEAPTSADLFGDDSDDEAQADGAFSAGGENVLPDVGAPGDDARAGAVPTEQDLFGSDTDED